MMSSALTKGYAERTLKVKQDWTYKNEITERDLLFGFRGNFLRFCGFQQFFVPFFSF